MAQEKTRGSQSIGTAQSAADGASSGRRRARQARAAVSSPRARRRRRGPARRAASSRRRQPSSPSPTSAGRVPWSGTADTAGTASYPPPTPRSFTVFGGGRGAGEARRLGVPAVHQAAGIYCALCARHLLRQGGAGGPHGVGQ
eukprot:gene6658-biopygen1395